MDKEDIVIRNNYKGYLEEITNRYLTVFVLTAMVIVLLFAASDLLIRHNINAFYTRLFPLSVAVFIAIFQIFTKNKYKRLKYKLYNLLIISCLVMMYAKYLVYIQNEGQAYSVMGIVVVIFLIALELKVSLLHSIIIFFSPLLAMVIILLTIVDLPTSKMVNFTNLFPMTILGFICNRVQNKLRFKLFQSNYWLNHEKIIAKELYEESLSMNEYLEEKNFEIETQNQAIEKANEELQSISRTKDKFFSIISHDLKTPFNAMIGFTNLLSKHYEDYTPEEKKKYIAILDKSANNTYKLLNNLLEWAQAQTDSDQLKLESTNLFLLVNDVFDLLRQTAKTKKLNLINQVDKHLIITADINKLKTVIRNLTTNAIKFSYPEGLISINSNIKQTNDVNKYVQISVIDTGIGISPDRQKKLFDITQKVTTLGTHDEIGTGLGLILCDEFVRRHQGEIWVESKIDKGSTFTFTLPHYYEMN